MADVFLSYRNVPDRRALVDRLAGILEAHGLTVWWDYGLEAGEPYREQIMAELSAAKVVSPLWCQLSVQSEWVLREAEIGRRKLIPARVQAITPPSAFEAVQSADLTSWDGSVDHDPLKRYIERVAERAGQPLRQTVSVVRQFRLLPPLAPLSQSGGAGESAAAARLRARLGDTPSLADLHRYAESFPGEDGFEARRLLDRLKAEQAAFENARRPQELVEFLRKYPEARQTQAAYTKLVEQLDANLTNARDNDILARIDLINTLLRSLPDATRPPEAQALLAKVSARAASLARQREHADKKATFEAQQRAKWEMLDVVQYAHRAKNQADARARELADANRLLLEALREGESRSEFERSLQTWRAGCGGLLIILMGFGFVTLIGNFLTKLRSGQSNPWAYWMSGDVMAFWFLLAIGLMMLMPEFFAWRRREELRREVAHAQKALDRARQSHQEANARAEEAWRPFEQAIMEFDRNQPQA